MSQYFGGYITVGTPHHGVKLVNSYQNGNLRDWFDDGCKQIVQDPVNALTAVIVVTTGQAWAGGILSSVGSSILGNVVCNVGYNRIEDGLDMFTAPQTLDDLKVGSTTIQLQSQSDKYRINIYGNEESPVHWRFLSSLKEANRPVDIPHNNYVARDGELGQTVNTVQGIFNVVGYASLTYSIIAGIMGNYVHVIPYANLGLQTLQGSAWLNKSESSWNDLIGANDTYPVGITQVNMFLCGDQLRELSQTWHEDGLNDYLAQRNALYANPDCWQTINVTKSIANHKISDGLVPELSAKIDASTCHLGILETNHQEEVHHPEAEEMYEKIFNNDQEIKNKCGLDVAQFFKIN